MGHKFAEIAFTESVREVQQALGSRAGYVSMEQGEDTNFILSDREIEFISARDSFYMASVSETGWPYVQHRGGPIGFMNIIDQRTIGFADFSGNRQYVSAGNLRKDNRVSLFFMDYPNRTRLKLLGRTRLVSLDEPELLAKLEEDDYRAEVERGYLIEIEAFDWNCPQHITPRYTEAQIDELIEPIIQESKTLKESDANIVMPRLNVLGDGPLPLVISGIRQLTPRIRAYELRDQAGAVLPEVEAGSHLRIPVSLADGSTEIRHYSICSNPGQRDIYEIAVLREHAGTGGSAAVHKSFDINLSLHCELPQNHFQLHNDNRPAILIAGGIGITPIKSMAYALRARGNEFHIHYAGRSSEEMVFRQQLLQEFGNNLTLCHSDTDQHMDIEQILSAAPDDAVFYVCGPERLIDSVTMMAEELNIGTEQIRFERFAATIDPDSQPIDVELRRSGLKLRVEAQQTILDAMLEAGVDAPFSCRAGNCRTCAVKVLEGEPDHRDSALSSSDREDDQLMCPCISRGLSEHLVLDI